MSDRAKQLFAAEALHDAFKITDRVTDLCHCVFPSRSSFDTCVEDGRQSVDRFLARVRQKSAAEARQLQALVDVLRDSGDLQRPDAIILLLIKARKAGIFKSTENYEKTSTPSVPTSGSSSPFLRRSASRDPIHRDKVKEELCSPAPLTQSNGTPPRRRARSRSISRTVLTASGGKNFQTPSAFYDSHSTEKPSSVVNPFYGMSSESNEPFNSRMGFSKMDALRTRSSLWTGSERSTVSVASSATKPLHPRLGVPPTVDLFTVCQETLEGLLGIAGTYVVEKGSGDLTLSPSCSIEDTYITLIEDLLLTGNRFLELKRKTAKWKGNSLRLILLHSISCCLEDYITDISDITLKDEPHLPQLAIITTLGPWKSRFSALERCYSLSEYSDLVALDDMYNLWNGYAGQIGHEQVEFVLSNMMQMFCQSLIRWLSFGTVDQGHNWMVGFDGTTHRLLHRPVFLTEDAICNIMKIGTSQEFVMVEEELLAYRSCMSREVTISRLMLGSERNDLDMFLRSMTYAIRKVIRQKFDQECILDHFRAARSFLLVEDSHFAASLFQQILRSTGGLRSTLSQKDATRALVCAVFASQQKFPFKVDIDASTSLNNSPNTSSRLQFVQPLHPIYHVEGFVARIFEGTRESYESIFQFVWSIHVTLFRLSTDTLTRIGRSLSSKHAWFKIYRHLLVVAHRWTKYVLNLRIFVHLNVSECSTSLHQKFGTAMDMLSARMAHQQFLKQLEANFFIDGQNEKILGLISTILQLLSELSQHISEFERDWEQHLGSDAFTESGDGISKGNETLREFERVELEAGVDISSRRTRLNVIDASLCEITGKLSHSLIVLQKEKLMDLPGLSYLLTHN